jgi:hypothetical protein
MPIIAPEQPKTSSKMTKLETGMVSAAGHGEDSQSTPGYVCKSGKHPKLKAQANDTQSLADCMVFATPQ